MRLKKQQTIPFLLIVLAIIILGLWIGLDNRIQNTRLTDSSLSREPELQCDIGRTELHERKNFDAGTVSPALRPGCRNCTGALLTRPVGGFNDDRFLISLFNYSGTAVTYDPDPSRSINYTFYARQMKPGTVSYHISRVDGLYRTEPLPPPPNFTVTVRPDTFTAEPGGTYTSEVTVHLQADSKEPNTWLFLHADVEGEPDAITDDWVRVAVDDGSEMAGMGLYHFYQGTGGYCQDLLVIPQGGSGSVKFLFRAGELDTGTVSLNLTPSPCDVDRSEDDGISSWPEGIHADVDPDRFTARSFADYYADLSFAADPSVRPGDYCFSGQLVTPTGDFGFSPIMVTVTPRDG